MIKKRISLQAKYDQLAADSKRTLLPLAKTSRTENNLYKYQKISSHNGPNGYLMNGIYKGTGSNYV